MADKVAAPVDLTLRAAEAASASSTCCGCLKSPGAFTMYALTLNFFVWVLSIAASQAIWFGVPILLTFFTPTKVILLGLSQTTSEFFKGTDAASVGPLMLAGMAFLIIAFIIAIVQFITDVLAFWSIRYSRHTRKVDYLVAWVAMASVLVGTIITGAGSSVGIAFLNKGSSSSCNQTPKSFLCNRRDLQLSTSAVFIGDGLGCAIVAILFAVANGALRNYMARMPEDTNFKPPFHQWCACCSSSGATKEAGGATAPTAVTAPPPAPAQQTV